MNLLHQKNHCYHIHLHISGSHQFCPPSLHLIYYHCRPLLQFAYMNLLHQKNHCYHIHLHPEHHHLVNCYLVHLHLIHCHPENHHSIHCPLEYHHLFHCHPLSSYLNLLHQIASPALVLIHCLSL